MNIEDWVKEELITTTPHDIPLWHWSDSQAIAELKENLSARGDFRHYRQGAVGHGLYASCSAVDLIERGPEVIHFKVKQGTQVLMVHPIVFQMGVPEFFETTMKNMGWSDFQLPKPGIDLGLFPDTPAIIDTLLDRLQLPCCFYMLGMNLACMIHDSSCLDFDPDVDTAKTVLEYHRANPQDIPMLAPHLLTAWLAKNS